MTENVVHSHCSQTASALLDRDVMEKKSKEHAHRTALVTLFHGS